MVSILLQKRIGSERKKREKPRKVSVTTSGADEASELSISNTVATTVNLYEAQIAKFKTRAQLKPLTLSEIRQMAEIVRTLLSIRKGMKDAEADTKRKNDDRELIDDLNRMPKHELLELVLPLLEEMGLDTEKLNFKNDKQVRNDEI